MNYYDKVTQGKSPLTIETMNLLKETAGFALGANITSLS